MGAILILLVVLILVVAFGPIVLGLFSLAVAVLGSVAAAAALICVAVGIVFIYALGCAFWVIWWCCDSKGAEAALRRANAERGRR